MHIYNANMQYIVRSCYAAYVIPTTTKLAQAHPTRVTTKPGLWLRDYIDLYIRSSLEWLMVVSYGGFVYLATPQVDASYVNGHN